MADNPAKHEFVDDYPYLAYASEVDTVAESGEGGESYTLPVASADTLGGVKVGSGLAIDNNGVLSSSGESYTLPTASADTLGGVKVGEGLAISENGTLSAEGDDTNITFVEISENEQNITEIAETAENLYNKLLNGIVYAHQETQEEDQQGTMTVETYTSFVMFWKQTLGDVVTYYFVLAGAMSNSTFSANSANDYPALAH